MTKKRLKNHLEKLLLLLGFVTLVLGCEKDNIDVILFNHSSFETNPLNKINPNDITTEVINWNEFSKKTSLSDKSQIFENFNIGNKSFSNQPIVTTNSDSSNEHLSVDQIEMIQHQGITTYTFVILENRDDNIFRNLVLRTEDDIEFEAYIAKYTPTEQWLASEQDSTPYEGQVAMYPYTGTYQIVRNGGGTSDCQYSIEVVWRCGAGNNHHPGHSDCRVGGAEVIAVIITEECSQGVGGGTSPPPTGSGDNDGDPFGTGTGSSGGETRGGNDGSDQNTNDNNLPLDGVLTKPKLGGVNLSHLSNIIEQPISSFDTEQTLKNKILAVGTYFNEISSVNFSELNQMLIDATSYSNLSWDDLAFMTLKTKEAYDILKAKESQVDPFYNTNFGTILSPSELALVENNLTSVAFLPHVKSLIGNHWPQTAEQWSAIGTIMGQFLVEIGLAVIPGSSIIDIVSGIDDGDYIAVSVGIAGLIVDAFGGTILKVIGKVGKVAYKTFKIFKIVFRYIDEVVDLITLGYKTDIVNGIVKISNSVGTAVAEIQDNVIRFLTNGAKSIVKVADLKLLDNVLPSPGGNIGKTIIDDKALRIKADNSDYADDISDIIRNGDTNGDKTEALMQDLLQQDGYTAVPNPHLPSNQGFDNVLIKRDSRGNITDVIINESKQVSNTGSISLSSNINGCGDCTQMSQDWVQYIINRMKQQGGNLENLANEIDDFNGTITQLVSGVNKTTGEIVIVNITGF